MRENSPGPVSASPGGGIRRRSFARRFVDGKYLFLMVLPTFLCLVLFHFWPMWGVLISFKNYQPFLGFMGSKWVGLDNFDMFITSPFFWERVKNTFLLSFYSLLWGFPMPILFALMLNEVPHRRFKKAVQTFTYMPHFYSTVVVVGIFSLFLSPSTGMFPMLLEWIGLPRIDFLSDSRWFRTIYIVSEIWQNTGWGAIIYLAALTAVDPQLHESAMLDGANKLKRIGYIVLPTIAPTIVTMLLLRCGSLLSVGFERAYLFQRPSTMEVGDVIQTYVYRVGLTQNKFGLATAVGLFNSLANLALLWIANFAARKVNETSLW